MADKKKREVKKKLNEAESIAYKQCVQQMFDWMGYPATAQMPKFFYGLLGQWHNTNNYSYEVVLETMNFIDSMVQRLDTKEFSSDSHKIKYICAIIRDHLNDGLKSFARKQKAMSLTQRTTNVPTDKDINDLDTSQTVTDRSNLNNVMQDIMGDLF